MNYEGNAGSSLNIRYSIFVILFFINSDTDPGKAFQRVGTSDYDLAEVVPRGEHGLVLWVNTDVWTCAFAGF